MTQLFGYIKSTLDYGLKYTRGDGLGTLNAYSDADFGGCLDSAKSTGGYIILKGGNVVAWLSKLQGNVTQSTTEAEYVALSETTKELMWLRRLDNVEEGKHPTLLRGDNQGSIKLAEDPQYRRRTRHIHVRYHYVREQIEIGNIHVEYVSTEENLADILTKALPKPAHARITAKLGIPFGGGIDFFFA